jgi:hypothetical protein
VTSEVVGGRTLEELTTSGYSNSTLTHSGDDGGRAEDEEHEEGESEGGEAGDEEDPDGGGGDGGGGDGEAGEIAETVANSSLLVLNRSRFDAGSTNNRKWRRKSTPMIGKETAARRNTHLKGFPWNLR